MEKDDNITLNINIRDSVIAGDLKIDTGSFTDHSEDEIQVKKQQFQQVVAELLLKLGELEIRGIDVAYTKLLVSLKDYIPYAHFWDTDFAMKFFITLRDHWEGWAGFAEGQENFEKYYIAKKNSISFNNHATKYGFNKEGAEFWEWQTYWYDSEKYRKAGLYHKAQECYFNINNLNNELINDWLSMKEKLATLKD